MLEEVRVGLCFEEKLIRLGDEVIGGERKWKPTWWKVKTCLQKAMESRRIENKANPIKNKKSNVISS